MKKEILGIIDCNLLLFKTRVNLLNNRTIPFKNRKKELSKKKCRKKVDKNDF